MLIPSPMSKARVQTTTERKQTSKQTNKQTVVVNMITLLLLLLGEKS